MMHLLLNWDFFARLRRLSAPIAVVILMAFASVASADTVSTNKLSLAPALPDLGASVVRVMGALALVLGIFLGGVWLFRNWQRLMVQRGRAPKLNVLEVRSLGGRQSIYVVAYQQERFLLASSPTGVNFLSHLPAAEGEVIENPPAAQVMPSFSDALKQVLKGK